MAMTDREKQMIEAYLPNPPDPTLGDQEFYFKHITSGGVRIIRVFALDVLPHREGTEYGLYQEHGTNLRWIDSFGLGDPSRGARRHDLYDNKQDCKDDTHMMYDDWEYLREVQKKEAMI